jgi:hypothetical protein
VKSQGKGLKNIFTGPKRENGLLYAASLTKVTSTLTKIVQYFGGTGTVFILDLGS